MRPSLLAATAASALLGGCTLLMPTDDELRGTTQAATGGSGGTGASGGASGSGGIAGGSTGGAANGCDAAAAFQTVSVASGARNPLLALRLASNDLSLVTSEGSDVFARSVSSTGASGAPVQLSMAGKATHVSASVGALDGRTIATWFDTTLRVGATNPTLAAKAVYSENPLDPDSKSPQYSAILGLDSSWALVWVAHADFARRLFGVSLDSSGNGKTPGSGYVPLTPEVGSGQCGHRDNPALTRVDGNVLVAYAWGKQDCPADGGAVSPAEDPDIHFVMANGDVKPQFAPQAVAPAKGVSDFPAVAGRGTELGFAWVDDRDGSPRVWFVRYASGTPVTSSLAPLSSGPPSANRAPSIAPGVSDFAVAWQSGGELHFRRVAPSGPGPDLVLATDALPGDTPSLAWAGDRWVVAWASAGATSQVRFSSCTP